MRSDQRDTYRQEKHSDSGPSLPSAMQREQPISLVHSRSASIEHRVAGSRGDRRRQREAHGESKAARVFGVVCLSRGSVSHRGQACWHVLPSTM